MNEIEQILALWREAEANGESVVLATVVKTSGSSYRLPGARLVLTRTGQYAGSISGGCLEAELIKKAWWLTENGPLVRRYDTTPDGEIATEYGLGCNGIIHVLLERLEPGSANVLRLVRHVREVRRAAAIALAIAPAAALGERLAIDCEGSVQSELPSAEHGAALEAMARDALRTGQSRCERLNDIEVFAETLTPALRLLVFGAGDDAIPVVNFAEFLGWQVWVFDGRAHYARREKFPEAHAVVVRAPGGDGPDLPVDAWTAAVLMSHSYRQDLEMLKELAGRRLRYLGILGPRKRTERMLSDAGLEGLVKSSVLHTPMGFDIGADGPQQVALSVIAEIQAVLNGRAGGFLRDRAGSIHAEEPDAASGDADDAWVRTIVCA